MAVGWREREPILWVAAALLAAIIAIRGSLRARSRMSRETDPEFYVENDSMKRTFWLSKTVNRTVRGEYENFVETHEERTQAKPAKANLVSSLLADGRHAPALDIDMQCFLVPSRTEGHFHLFIDKPMQWRSYKKLLRAPADAGIIEEGYYKASVKRQATDLRLTNVRSWLTWGHP